MKDLIEKIKPIQDYEGLYEISNYGYVISLAKQWVVGIGIRRKEKTNLKAGLDGAGYNIVHLWKNGETKTIKISLLVYDHFGEGKRDGIRIVVDHIKERWNDRIDNLQLLTQRENTIKGYMNKKTSSKYMGVYWHKISRKWRAQIRIGKKREHLGLFNKEIKASNKYKEALRNLKRRNK